MVKYDYITHAYLNKTIFLLYSYNLLMNLKNNTR